MDITELQPGDTVLVEAVVTKVVDDAEGVPPVVLVSITPAHRTDRNVSALVNAPQIHEKISSQAPPESEPYLLGTLGRAVKHDG